MSRNRRLNRGFTLIELLVIIVVLGVILAATIPGIARWLPRYRLERVAENFVQTCRVARLGAIQLHCNHIVRFFVDPGRITPCATGVFEARGWDLYIDRNNNMVTVPSEQPPTGVDKRIAGSPVYRDVVIDLDPTDGAKISKPPYNTFPRLDLPGGANAQRLVFRPDGRIYSFDGTGFTPISQCAVLFESETLTGGTMTANKATFKYRWVEIDGLGSIRLTGKGGAGN